MRGQRKPTALKLIEGDRDHATKAEKAKAAREPHPNRDAPTAPAWMDAGAKRKWKTLVSDLNAIGVLTKVDGDILALYCQAYSDHDRLTRDLREHGEVTTAPSGYKMLRPEVALRNRARDDLKKFGAELGIGAASRTKIEVKPPDAGQTPLEKIRDRTSR